MTTRATKAQIDSACGALTLRMHANGDLHLARNAPNLRAIEGLLKTPTAQLAVNGGSQHPDKRKAGGHALAPPPSMKSSPPPTPSSSGTTSPPPTGSHDEPTLF